MNIKRYHHSHSGLMVEAADGDYVRFMDANALLSLNAELLEAATTVLDGLNERIDMAESSGSPCPLFKGISALHAAIAKARSQS